MDARKRKLPQSLLGRRVRARVEPEPDLLEDDMESGAEEGSAPSEDGVADDDSGSEAASEDGDAPSEGGSVGVFKMPPPSRVHDSSPVSDHGHCRMMRTRDRRPMAGTKTKKKRMTSRRTRHSTPPRSHLAP